jgi:hypothetical protein
LQKNDCSLIVLANSLNLALYVKPFAEAMLHAIACMFTRLLMSFFILPNCDGSISLGSCTFLQYCFIVSKWSIDILDRCPGEKKSVDEAEKTLK